MILLSPVLMLRLVSLLCHIKMNFFPPSPSSHCGISKSVSFFLSRSLPPPFSLYRETASVLAQAYAECL